MRRTIVGYALLVAPSAYLFASLWSYMLSDPFPYFNDPSIWLKLAHALQGNTFPMWGETTFQYPPLFPALVSLASLGGNELAVLKVLGILLLVLIPISSYPLTKSLTGSMAIAIVAAWLIAFGPIYQEMIGWGGYPNELGIVLLTLAMGYAVITFSKPTRLNFALLFALSFLTTMAHHLTFIIFAGGFGIATFILFLFTTDFKRFYTPLVALAGAGTGFAIWRLLAGPFQYQLYNGASLAIRPLDLDAIQWTFKSFYVLGALVFLAALGAYWLFKNKKFFELGLLISFVAIPYLAAQSYFIGIALDFRRFPAFSVVPLSILAAISLNWMKGIRQGVSVRVVGGNEPRIEGSLSPTRVGLALVFIFLFLGTIQVGVATEAAVASYYHAQTDYAYQGSSRLQAINWIRANTSRTAVIVADETLGRWTEGYGDRRVLLDLAPYQSFISGEVPRAIAADLILSSNAELANPNIRMRDGTPYQLGHTPVFGWSDGLGYHDTVFLSDAYVRVQFTAAGSNWVEAPYNPSSFSMDWLARTKTSAVLEMNFETGGLFFNKTESMGLYSAAASVSYLITPKNGSVLQSLSLPIWVPFGDYGSFAVINSTTYSLSDNGVSISITPTGDFQSARFGIDNSTGEQRLLLTYAPNENRITAGFKLVFPNTSPIAWRTTLDANTSDEYIAQYQVSYIAIGLSRFDVSKFASDSRFELVYENSQIAIFELFKPG